MTEFIVDDEKDVVVVIVDEDGREYPYTVDYYNTDGTPDVEGIVVDHNSQFGEGERAELVRVFVFKREFSVNYKGFKLEKVDNV
jgi:hypothetical protein